ncbi:MAG: hypothetical protein L3J72_00575 [Thermoplasmata archaeon]|nr:hypothetical protein [Thermoplasmata archaeon]
MSRKPTWEDADLLLRIEQIAAHPQTRAALDWFERTAGEAGEMTAHRIPREAREFEHVQRLLELYELIGTLARQELISEPLVQHRWPSHALWQFLAPTIDRERKSVGPFVGENFEWLAQRSRQGAPKPAARQLR